MAALRSKEDEVLMSKVFGVLLFVASLMVLMATAAWVAVGVSMVDRSTFCEAGLPVSISGMIGGVVAWLLAAAGSRLGRGPGQATPGERTRLLLGGLAMVFYLPLMVLLCQVGWAGPER